MNNIRIAFTVLLVFILSSTLLAQKNRRVILKSAELSFRPNINQLAIDSFNKQVLRYQNKTLVTLQFQSIPGDAAINILRANGIVLTDYLGDQTYLAGVTGIIKSTVLNQSGCIAFLPWSPGYKMESGLGKRNYPAHAVKVAGTIDLQISISPIFSLSDAETFLDSKKFEIISREWVMFDQFTLRIAINRLEELASSPLIQYIQPALGDPQPLTQNDRQLSRSDVLNASVENGGRGLNGEGIVIGIGDNADIRGHVDFSGRLINRNTFSAGHGIHVSGIAAGGGIINELYRGYAPKAIIINDLQASILSNTPLYSKDYGMVVTNNAYGGFGGCVGNGAYDLYSRNVDQLSLLYPEVLHVFAAGNSGTSNCTPYATGFNTIEPSYQSAKNVLTIGATNDTGRISNFSSKGPAMDGRIKPELTAMGESVVSTWPVNTYISSQGTSMSAPGVTGGAALLYQRYRQLKGNNPRNALIKALLCNGAEDKGNRGPDYTYGFGSMNLLRSMQMLEQEHYIAGGIANGARNTHTVSVPPNTAQLKVMLYWNDAPGAAVNRQALTNDLDAALKTPSGTIVLPWILDTLPANINSPATTGEDHLNNIEQLVIDHPSPGNYEVTVKGSVISQGIVQEYYLVYDVVPTALDLTYPVGEKDLCRANR